MAEPNLPRRFDDFRTYRTETSLGNVVSFADKWYLYTLDAIFVRELTEQETRAVNDELMNRSLPHGEDR
jgi:hypothetical protein